MNILFVSAVLPYPLHSGGQIRMYQLLKRLSRKHEITLVSFIRSEDERAYAKDLDFCRDVHMVMRGRAWQLKYLIPALVGTYPFLLATYRNRDMRTLLAGLLKNTRFDLMHAEPFYVWPSLPQTTVPLVVSEHNVEYDVYRAYTGILSVIAAPVLLADAAKLKYWERAVWRHADGLTAVSRADAEVMEAYLSHSVDVVPNGVDCSEFPYRVPVKRDRYTVLFVGNFRWHPNRDAVLSLVRRIWPGIRQAIPQARLCVVGKDMPQRLRFLVTRAGGEIREDVNDIAAVYRDADVLVAPHGISGGTKFKMLEAMASGLPIVTTKEGMHGLDAEPDVHYMEAQTPEDCVVHVRALWDNSVLARSIAAAARRLVEERYQWDTIADTLDRTWKQTYAKRR